MFRASLFALLGGVLILSGGAAGQVAKKPKKEEATQKKDAPAKRYKGMLPANWGKLGLTDKQKQEIYKIQVTHNMEIKKLEAKIRELKGARDKEMRGVLTELQRKRLAEILTGK